MANWQKVTPTLAGLASYRECVETRERKKQATPTASAILEDGTIVEMVYKPDLQRTLFAVFSAGRWRLEESIRNAGEAPLVPYSPRNNLIQNGVVLLPSEPVAYKDEATLARDVQRFIHQYVDLDPAFERVAAHYVLLSWVYDCFNELPYLCFRGDFGSGKTRALLTLGSLCYRSIFASGASTVSPIFHTLDAFRGTLMFDEADFRFSDEKSELVKILNNGNVRGMPVLRTMTNKDREFNPRAFHVFGPKIVATRGKYEDRGLESRFLTADMGARRLRGDIPFNLPDGFSGEARELRNKLLMYRFRRLGEVRLDARLADPDLEPRFNQILLPLLSIADDPDLRADMRAMGRETQLGLVADRGLQIEAQVLEVLAELMTRPNRTAIPLSDVVARFVERFGGEYERPVTNRWIGSIVRTRLNLRTYKTNGVFVIPLAVRAKIELLCARFGVGITTDGAEAA